jgi:hypothetical protein
MLLFGSVLNHKFGPRPEHPVTGVAVAAVGGGQGQEMIIVGEGTVDLKGLVRICKPASLESWRAIDQEMD